MGKKLIIKGANFAQNAIDTTFNPLNWFVDAVDNVSKNIPTGKCIAKESSIATPKTSVGMVSPVQNEGMLYYGTLSNALDQQRFSTTEMISLATLYENGYRSLKLTPKATGNIVVLYSDTPTASSINPYSTGQMVYNTSTNQVTIPINSTTCVVFQAKSLTNNDTTVNTSSITRWLDISIE